MEKIHKIHKIFDGLQEIGYTTRGAYGYLIHAEGKLWGEHRDLDLFNTQFALDWSFILNPAECEDKYSLYINNEEVKTSPSAEGYEYLGDVLKREQGDDEEDSWDLQF